MRFDIHVRQTMRDRLADVSARMAAWDQQQPTSPDLHRRLIDAIEPFEHTTHAPAYSSEGWTAAATSPRSPTQIPLSTRRWHRPLSTSPTRFTD